MQPYSAYIIKIILRGGSLTGLTEEQVKERIEAGQTNADENTQIPEPTSRS